jgi:hypothetical protein
MMNDSLISGVAASPEGLCSLLQLLGRYKGREVSVLADLESASKLHRPSDCRSLTKLAQTFADTGVSRGQRDGSPRPYSWLSRPTGDAEIGQPKVRNEVTKKRPLSLLTFWRNRQQAKLTLQLCRSCFTVDRLRSFAKSYRNCSSLFKQRYFLIIFPSIFTHYLIGA